MSDWDFNNSVKVSSDDPFSFDFNEYADKKLDRQPVPKGTYRAVISGVKLKDSEWGKVIEVELQIQHAEHDGRKVWLNIYMEGDDQEKRDRGRAMLAQTWRACGGNGNPKSEDDLIATLTDKIVQAEIIVSKKGKNMVMKVTKA